MIIFGNKKNTGGDAYDMRNEIGLSETKLSFRKQSGRAQAEQDLRRKSCRIKSIA